MENLNKLLKDSFPVFWRTEKATLDDDSYMLYGAFGSFFSDLISLETKGTGNYNKSYFNDFDIDGYYSEKDLAVELYKAFKLTDDIFKKGNKNDKDVLNTCVFEALMGVAGSYSLAKKYLSNDTFNHFLEISKFSS